MLTVEASTLSQEDGQIEAKDLQKGANLFYEKDGQSYVLELLQPKKNELRINSEGFYCEERKDNCYKENAGRQGEYVAGCKRRSELMVTCILKYSSNVNVIKCWHFFTISNHSLLVVSTCQEEKDMSTVPSKPGMSARTANMFVMHLV